MVEPPNGSPSLGFDWEEGEVLWGLSVPTTMRARSVASKSLSRGLRQRTEIAPPVTGDDWGYRRKARLSVKHVPKKGGVLVGFREADSPYVAQISSCVVLDPRVGLKLKAIAACVEELD